MSKIWARGELFDHGVFPCAPRFTAAAVLDTFKALRRDLNGSLNVWKSIWMHHATQSLGLGDEEAALLLDIFRCFDAEPSRFSDAAHETVDVRAFSLFVLLQTFSAMRFDDRQHWYDVAWPAGGGGAPHLQLGAPASPRGLRNIEIPSPMASPRNKTVSFKAGDDSNRLTFLRNNIYTILRLISRNPDMETVMLTAADVDVLEFLFCAPTTGLREPLSLLSGLFAGRELVADTAVAEWLESRLCWMEMLYPNIANAPGATAAIVAGAQPTSPSQAHSPHGPQKFVFPEAQSREASQGGPLVLNGLMKTTVLRGSHEIRGSDVYIVGCHDATVYIASNVRNACVIGCTDCVVVIGAASHFVTVDLCERVTVITACRCLRIGSSLDCVAHALPMMRPVIFGESRGLVLAPHNAHYLHQREHVIRASLRYDERQALRIWSEPLTWRRSTSTPAAHSDKDYSLLPPEKFFPLFVPAVEAVQGGTVVDEDLLCVPPEYAQVVRARDAAALGLQRAIDSALLSDEQQREVQAAVQGHFREWLASTSHVRQLVDLVRFEQEVFRMQS